MIWRYSQKRLQISLKSDTLIFFSKTGQSIFLVFRLKLVLNMPSIWMKPIFQKNLLFGDIWSIWPQNRQNLVVLFLFVGPVNVFLFYWTNWFQLFFVCRVLSRPFCGARVAYKCVLFSKHKLKISLICIFFSNLAFSLLFCPFLTLRLFWKNHYLVLKFKNRSWIDLPILKNCWDSIHIFQVLFKQKLIKLLSGLSWMYLVQ